MDWGIALGVAIVVVVLGGIAAVLWWRLANKAAPHRGGGPRGTHPGHEEVVIIRDNDKDAPRH